MKPDILTPTRLDLSRLLETAQQVGLSERAYENAAPLEKNEAWAGYIKARQDFRAQWTPDVAVVVAVAAVGAAVEIESLQGRLAAREALTRVGGE